MLSLHFINTRISLEAEISSGSNVIALLKIVLLTGRSKKVTKHEDSVGYSVFYALPNNLQQASMHMLKHYAYAYA